MHVGERSGDSFEHHAQLPANQIGHRRRAPLIGHMDDVNAGTLLEQFRGQMLNRAGTARTVGQLAGLGAGERNQFANGSDR